MSAGYSGRPLGAKLGLRPGQRVALLGPPPAFEGELEPLPAGVRLARRLAPELDMVVLFSTSRRLLARRFPVAAAALRPEGSLWVAWPKRASGRATDLTENVVREVGLAAGLVDTKVCAVDDVWSGLRFVYRLRDRPTPAAAGRV